MNAILSPQDQINMALTLARQGTTAGRPHFAYGGIPMHPAIAAALAAAQRPHFDDGGGEGGGGGDGEGSSHSSSSSSSGGDSGGDGHGSGSDSSSSSSSGSSGGVGGFGGGSSDGYGGNSNSNNSSGSSGGVGGFGGGSSDGYGGNSSSSTSSGTSGGVGGFGGGSSDGYGGSNSSTQSSGGFSSGAASGSDGGVGGAVSSTSSSTGSLGGSAGTDGGGYGSATSGPVGSMAGSVGAPAAGGFSSEGAPATGGFGNFGSTPTANSNPTGMVGATPSASMMSGQTAGQSMSNEAANGAGEAGEGGTGSLGNVSSAGAFGSFGPSMGVSNPYGSMTNAQNAFGSAPSTDSAPASPSFSGYAGLSADGQALGAIGTGGVPTSAVASPGAYGLSTSNLNGDKPGFDNFSATGNFQQSSLGDTGFTGFDAAPGTSYSTPAGVTDGRVADAMFGHMAGPDGTVEGTPSGVASDVPSGTTAAVATAPTVAEHGYSPEAIGGMFGDIGSIFGGLAPPSTPSTASPSPYGTLSQTPMGPLNVGPLSRAMGTDTTGTTPGLNADGDPTAVNGTSALTIHGTQTEAAQGAYDAPGATTSFGGITDQQAFNAHQNVIANGYASPQDSATLSGYAAQQAAPQAVQTAGVHPAVAGAMAAVGQPRGDVAGPQNTSTSDAQAPSASTTVSPSTLSDYTARMQKFESGNDPNAVSPTGAYGQSQFTQGTWSGVAQNNPDLGLPASPRQATPEQYSAATNALTNENVNALQQAGITPTFSATYLAHNIGINAAVSALSKSDDTPIGQAGIPARTMAVNPAVFGGVQTVGDLKGKLDGIMGQGVVNSTPAAIAPGRYANYSPGAASGMDSAAPSSFNGISPESTYSPGVATPGTEPSTTTTTTPAPYGISPEVQNALTVNGLPSTPVTALAVDTLGVANGIAVMNGEPNAPISSVDISPETVQAHPDLFSGVQTVGDLQGKIAAAAPTAGSTTQTVTTPGTPAVNGLGDLPGYSYSPGAASGLDTPDTSAQETGISQPGVYGTPSPLTVTRGILAGQQATADGFSPGAASGADTAMDPTTPDGSPAKHLSVPNWMGNGVAGIAAGSLLGPAGTLLGIGNSISGFMGGPTAADGINAALAHPGAPGSVTGSPTGASNSPVSNNDSLQQQNANGGDGSGSGVGAGGGSSSTTTGDTSNPTSSTMPPLTIRRQHQYYNVGSPSMSFYNPLTDPAVARALAAMRT